MFNRSLAPAYDEEALPPYEEALPSYEEALPSYEEALPPYEEDSPPVYEEVAYQPDPEPLRQNTDTPAPVQDSDKEASTWRYFDIFFISFFCIGLLYVGISCSDVTGHIDGHFWKHLRRYAHQVQQTECTSKFALKASYLRGMETSLANVIHIMNLFKSFIFFWIFAGISGPVNLAAYFLCEESCPFGFSRERFLFGLFWSLFAIGNSVVFVTSAVSLKSEGERMLDAVRKIGIFVPGDTSECVWGDLMDVPEWTVKMASSARDCGIVLMILSAMKLFRSLVRVPGILRARKNQRREREGLPQGHALQAVLPDGDADLVV